MPTLHGHTTSYNNAHRRLRGPLSRMLLAAAVVTLLLVNTTLSALAAGYDVTTLAAISKIDEWFSLPNTRLLSEKEEHWMILRSLLAEAGTAANLVTDSHLAALAISSGAILVSCDNDFARFRGLRWENPLREA